MRVNFREELISQIPALQLLKALGYTYLPPAEALRLRGHRESNVLLEPVLENWLRENNKIEVRGQQHEFSDANIKNAIAALKDAPLQKGLIAANEDIYELLTLGKSFEQMIHGDRRSYSLHYIDWQHPQNNVYHVTDEFSVEKYGSRATLRPDVVLFVNGIPLVIIECKRPSNVKGSGELPVEEAISQMVRNQRMDAIPNLFVYSQIVLALSMNDARYATTGTHSDFWAVWKEQAEIDTALQVVINRRLSPDEKAELYDHRDQAQYIRAYFDAQGERLPTEQDRALYSLLHPARLLELIYQFILFDGGVKKIARYQQYFAIKSTLERVTHLAPDGSRAGGVIWHTTGSGKSLTMVMLAKALALHPDIRNPRVVLVTDWVDLDEQIWRTFRACGKQAVQADSGAHLMELVQSNRADIITTVIDKFESVTKQKIKDHNPDVFVLVDESHRSQYGSSHARMRQVFEKACYIGFTGTPLLKKDKQTALKFGGFIHKYTMRQAVEDQAVVPLFYEGRLVDLDVNRDVLDEWFERRTRHLTDEQKRDLKRKMSRAEEISRAEQRLQAIAYDIATHYEENWRDTGFKAQLAASSKEIAIKYLHYLEEEGIRAAVLISAPDTREGHDDPTDETTIPAVQSFWRRMMERYGSEENFNREIKGSFGREDGIEILNVVDKLLVGFDEPRNTVLYVDKSLRDHALLQAIARVNRLFEGKERGYIIDYRGVLGELNTAIQTYNALEDFDEDDVSGTITDIAAILGQLPQLHAQLRDIFKTLPNQQDAEALERFLEPEDVRQQFYDALNAFASALRAALGSETFYEQTPEARIDAYKRDLLTYHNLRASVRQRYAEAVDYKDYEDKIRKLMDTHIQAGAVKPITNLVDIFDEEKFDAEVERLLSPKSKADTIAYRLKRTITEKMEADPAFYRKFSQLIDETIEAYRQRRLSELELLNQMGEILDQVRSGQDSTLPRQLNGHRHAPAYYGVLQEHFTPYGDPNDGAFLDLIAETAVSFETIIERRKIRDWIYNPGVQADIKNDLEDCLLDLRQAIPLSGNEMGLIVDRVVEVARQRDRI